MLRRAAKGCRALWEEEGSHLAQAGDRAVTAPGLRCPCLLLLRWQGVGSYQQPLLCADRHRAPWSWAPGPHGQKAQLGVLSQLGLGMRGGWDALWLLSYFRSKIETFILVHLKIPDCFKQHL